MKLQKGDDQHLTINFGISLQVAHVVLFLIVHLKFVWSLNA